MGCPSSSSEEGYSNNVGVNGIEHPVHLEGELNAVAPDETEEIVIDGLDRKEDKRSQLFVDYEDGEQKPDILRLDPEEVQKIGKASKYEFLDAPAQRLHVASTVPSGTISLILDENATTKDDTALKPPESPVKGLSRTNSAPCYDRKNGIFDADKTRKRHKISHRKRKRMMKRLGSITSEGAVKIDEERGMKILPDLYDESGHEEPVYEEGDEKQIRSLQIAMLIVGTRGDIQPFVAIGKELQKQGHRVRLATHTNFKEFVKSAGLEYFPLGGDPKVLAGYMVNNKGFLPSGPKDVKVQRKQLKEIVNSLLPACIERDPDTLIDFKAEAIISNPPAYGHVHVAEALNVPIHLYFTMPWTPTSEFPHPLSRLTNSNFNKISYQVVDSMIWLGIRSMINDFRKKKLNLRPISYLSKGQGSLIDVPFCYVWSPCVVPKPKDWGPLIDVVGYCFLELAQDYKPPDELSKWLQAGSKPIYIGFGSLPVKDPKGMTNTIIKALEITKQRGLVDKGWGGIGDDSSKTPEYVYFIKDCPHDWLFPQCAAVVHHGGAGTTAAGLKAACPTTIVPFFGDQPFWGARVHDRGIGPVPIPVDDFTLDKLVKAIEFMLNPEVKRKAEEMAKCIQEEDGVRNAVKAFHKQLPKVIPTPPPPPPPTFGRKIFNQMCCYNHHSKSREIEV